MVLPSMMRLRRVAGRAGVHSLLADRANPKPTSRLRDLSPETLIDQEPVSLSVRGTRGVLLQTRETGAVPTPGPILDALVAEGFHIAPPLIRDARSRRLRN
jgi:hypothetical protein